MTQKYTENKKASNRKWDEANLDRLSVAAPKGTKAEIKSAAAAQNQSVNTYILEAVRRRMESERDSVGTVSNAPESPSERDSGGGGTETHGTAETGVESLSET